MKQVAEACVLSSILYGCETWFTLSFGKIETMYMKRAKGILSVCRSGCNDVCLLEACMLPKDSLYLSEEISTL